MEEMWRQRELENKASRDKRSRREYREEVAAERDRYAERRSSNGEANNSSSDQDDDGLKDEDIEKFLQSKVKRGRGAVGSRMDEPGPYRARPEGPDTDVRLKEDWEARIARPVAGPSLPLGLDSRQENKKRKEKSIQVDGSGSDDVEEVKERKRRRESKERKRKEKRKFKDLEKHSKKRKRRH